MPQKTQVNKRLALQIFRLMSGFQISQALYVLAKLGIADLLKSGPWSYQKLAKFTQTYPGSLYRLLRCLASFGLFREFPRGCFALTALGNCLQSEASHSMRNLIIFYGEQVYPIWGNLLYSIKTGKSAFEQLHKMSLFDYVARFPKFAESFNKTMMNRLTPIVSAVVKAYDFSRCQTVVDVGGGWGLLLANILEANPKVKGVLFDTPKVVTGTKRCLKKVNLLKRCKIIGGDFFQSVPADGDCYLLSRIIHDWDDQRASSILKNCWKAIVKNGRILLLEELIPARNKASFIKLRDIHMLVMNGGGERTKHEYQTLFHSTGFALSRVIATTSPISIIEGVPIGK